MDLSKIPETSDCREQIHYAANRICEIMQEESCETPADAGGEILGLAKLVSWLTKPTPVKPALTTTEQQ